MTKEFIYEKSPLSIDRLSQEISASVITISLDHINLLGAIITIYFKADLSSGEITILDNIIVAHTGIPLIIQEIPQQVVLNSPSAFDNKPIVQASPRPIGTYTYLSAQSDNPNDPSETSGGIKLKYSHAIGQDNANQNVYFDINSIRNETHLNGAYLQWADANLDEIEVEICCKTSEAALVAGINTNYKAVAGILIMTAGDGNLSIPNWDLILPVQMVPNEHGVRPAGYWNCDYNTSTHKFENYVFAADGTGEFNIFSEEIEFNCFIPCFPMLKCGQQSIESKDVTRLGHNMRIKALIKTEQTVDDHAWKFCAVVYLYRKHT